MDTMNNNDYGVDKDVDVDNKATTPDAPESDKTTSKNKANKKPATKKIKIKIPLTKQEKDDVYVAVNGKSYLIKRGVYVEVPVSVYEVLQHKEEMLMQAIEVESNAMGKADDSELN